MRSALALLALILPSDFGLSIHKVKPDACSNANIVAPRRLPKGKLLTHSFITADYAPNGSLPQVDKCSFPTYEHAKPRVMTVRAGESLYIPAYWWHWVQSEGNATHPAVAVSYWTPSPHRTLRKPAVFPTAEGLTFKALDYMQAERLVAPNAGPFNLGAFLEGGCTCASDTLSSPNQCYWSVQLQELEGDELWTEYPPITAAEQAAFQHWNSMSTFDSQQLGNAEVHICSSSQHRVMACGANQHMFPEEVYRGDFYQAGSFKELLHHARHINITNATHLDELFRIPGKQPSLPRTDLPAHPLCHASCSFPTQHPLLQTNSMHQRYRRHYRRLQALGAVHNNQLDMVWILWWGNQNLHTGLHFDAYFNTLSVLQGTKHVVLYPPSDWRYLYPVRMPKYKHAVPLLHKLLRKNQLPELHVNATRS